MERRKKEEHAVMQTLKFLLRWFFLLALFLFPFTFYVPVYFDEKKSVDIALHGWEQNRSRSIPLYVFPNNDTTLLIPSQLCSQPLLLLIVVCSAINNNVERATIRETWGNYSSVKYKLVFLIGTTQKQKLQDEIDKEFAIHNDIIQENFIDTYNNLTLKSVMMLKFVKNHCENIQYIFKTDDDMFTYIPNLIKLIKTLMLKNLKHMLIGKLICRAKPILEASSKWYTPRYMYSRNVYPHYLSGTGYLMDKMTALKLYEAALEIPILHLEDVFITGLCAQKANVTPRFHSGFTYNTRPLDPCLYLRNQNIITSHRVTVDNMKELWVALNNGTSCLSKNLTHLKLDFLKLHPARKNHCS